MFKMNLGTIMEGDMERCTVGYLSFHGLSPARKIPLPVTFRPMPGALPLLLAALLSFCLYARF